MTVKSYFVDKKISEVSSSSLAVGVAKTVAFLCFGGLCVVTAGIEIHTSNQLKMPISKLNSLLDTSEKTMLLVNKATNDLRLTLDNVNKGAVDERRYFEVQLPVLMMDTHNVLVGVVDTTTQLQLMAKSGSLALNTTSETLSSLQPTIKSSTVTLDTLNTTIIHADDLLTQPAILHTMKNVDKTMDNVAKTTSHVEVITEDAKEKVEEYAHPPKKKLTIWGAVDGFFLWLHSRVIPPIF